MGISRTRNLTFAVPRVHLSGLRVYQALHTQFLTAEGDKPHSGGISLGDRPKLRIITAKPTKVLSDHRQDLATSATSMAVGVRGAARTKATGKTTEIVPIMIRSARKEHLNAIEPKMKLRIRENRAVVRSTRCRKPRATLAHDRTASTRQRSVSSNDSRRLLSIL